MADKPPKAVNAELRAVLRRLSPQPPLRLRPDGAWMYRPGLCHQNVREHVSSHGGSPQFGWIVRDAGAVFHFEFHCVWRRADGVLVDVTPAPAGLRELLFLPDAERSFDFEHRLSWANRLWRRDARVWTFEWKGRVVAAEKVVIPRGIEG